MPNLDPATRLVPRRSSQPRVEGESRPHRPTANTKAILSARMGQVTSAQVTPGTSSRPILDHESVIIHVTFAAAIGAIDSLKVIDECASDIAFRVGGPGRCTPDRVDIASTI